MRKLVFIITIALSFSCSNQPEKNNPVNAKFDPVEKASVDTLKSQAYSKNPVKSCEELREEYTLRQKSIDSILKRLILENQSAPINNIKLLESLLNKNDSLFEIDRPLAAIFEGIDSLPFIFSDVKWIFTEIDGVKNHSRHLPERSIIDRYDTVTEVNENYHDDSYLRKNFPQAVDENSEFQNSIFVYNKNSISRARISSIGIQFSECDDEFVFYNFEAESNDNLFSSPLNLDLEYGSWEVIDSITANDPIYNCSGCPSSGNEGRTFAKLKGIPNVYFIYAGNLENAKELDTPYRELVYVDEEYNFYSLWWKSIDLFSCGCL